MDPNANLAEQLRLARDPEEWDHDSGTRLAELVVALDEWIRKGGFLPDAWKPKEIKYPDFGITGPGGYE